MFFFEFMVTGTKPSSQPQWLHSTTHVNISWPVLTHLSKSMYKLHFIHLDPNGKARSRIDLHLLTCVSHICTYTKSHFPTSSWLYITHFWQDDGSSIYIVWLRNDVGPKNRIWNYNEIAMYSAWRRALITMLQFQYSVIIVAAIKDEIKYNQGCLLFRLQIEQFTWKQSCKSFINKLPVLSNLKDCYKTRSSFSDYICHESLPLYFGISREMLNGVSWAYYFRESNEAENIWGYLPRRLNIAQVHFPSPQLVQS